MDDKTDELHRTVDNIGQIVRRDGGALDFEKFDPATGELVVAFRTAPNDDCAACTIDEATVRAFLEEAVKAQGIAMTSLRIQTS
jgi:Fe-S cluster biogenesis protein NfuA